MARLINGNNVQGITAQTDADFCGGIAGGVTGILAIGRRMEAEIVSNTPRIYDGTLLTKEGRRIQIDYGSYDDFTIPAGTEGVTRYFLIGYKLTTESNGAQTCSTFVEASTASGTIEEHMLKDGYTDVYISLYRVTQTGTANTISDCLLPMFSSLVAEGGSDLQTTNITWKGLNVRISVFRSKLAFVSVTGATNTDLNTRRQWETIATMAGIKPSKVIEGVTIVNNGVMFVRYQWTTGGAFRIGNSVTSGGSSSNILSGMTVNFNFSFAL